MIRTWAPENLWEIAAPLIPARPRRPQGGGRRRVDDRAVLAAIVYVTQAGCSWWKLPEALFGVTWATAHRQFAQPARRRPGRPANASGSVHGRRPRRADLHRSQGKAPTGGRFGPAVHWREVVASLGLPDFHVHDRRHTGNTLAASAGAGTRELMRRFGQSTTPRRADPARHRRAGPGDRGRPSIGASPGGPVARPPAPAR
jgi:transposase